MDKKVLSLVIISVTCCSSVINEKCILENGQEGQCLLIKDCKSALDGLKSKLYPEHCGFSGLEPVVCCDKNEKQTLRAIGVKKCEETYSNPIPYFEIPKLPDGYYASVGGYLSESKLYSHMAALGYGEENSVSWGCGGSLVSEKFVLTAAHCIRSSVLGPVKFIRLGDLNLNSTQDDALPQNFNVKNTFIHPKFKAPSTYHDIALIELDRPALINNYVIPGCLNVEKVINNTNWRATGWGATSFGGKSADHLTVIEIKPYTFEECSKSYENTDKKRLSDGIDDETQICAGEVGKDTCKGDSGGPLQVHSQYIRGWIILGVTSFGKACGVTASPGVYTRVSYYVDWIESIVWPEN